MLDSRRRWVLLFFILLLSSIAGWAVWGWRLGHEYDRRIAALAAAGYPVEPKSLEDEFRDPSNGWPLLVEAAGIHEACSSKNGLFGFFPEEMEDPAVRANWIAAWPGLKRAIDRIERAAGRPFIALPPEHLAGDHRESLAVTEVMDLLEARAALFPAERLETAALLLNLAARIRPLDFLAIARRHFLLKSSLSMIRRAVDAGEFPPQGAIDRLRASLADLSAPWPDLADRALRTEVVNAHWIVSEFRAGRDPLAEARSGMRMVRNFFDPGESSLIERVNDRLDGPIFGLPSASYRYRINRPLLYRFGLRLLSNLERHRSTRPPSELAEGFDRLYRIQLAQVRLASFALDVMDSGGLDGVEIPIDPQTGQPFEVERTDTHVVLFSTLHDADDELLGVALEDGLSWKIKIPR